MAESSASALPLDRGPSQGGAGFGPGPPPAGAPPPAPLGRRVRWMRRLSTQVAIGQIAVLVLVIGLEVLFNSRVSEQQLLVQYEHRAQAVGQTVANLPAVVGALDGRGPRSAVQPLALRITHATGAEFVVVVDPHGIRLSSPDPLLVGKSFHEAVVSLDGRVHLRVDPGKPYPNAQARVPVFGPNGRVVGEVSVGFLERQVAGAARRALPTVALATLLALPVGLLGALLLASRLKRLTFGLELDELTALMRNRERLAKEQSALQRVARRVAEGASQQDVFAAIVEELLQIAEVDSVQLLRYEGEGAAVRLAGIARDGQVLAPGEVFQVAGQNVLAEVWATGRPARIDDSDTITGGLAEFVRCSGTHSIVASPITVDGEIWAVIVAGRTLPEPMAPSAEQQIAEFTDLAATAISNAQAREELAASRRRVVSAADEMRRRIERNLHDGAQQGLVLLSIELRELQRDMPADSGFQTRLGKLQHDIGALQEDLRVLSRGLHPAILTRGGLGPAIQSLARNFKIPVELGIDLEGRLPEALEVTAYYVIAEAITNVAKHAQASVVHVTVERADGVLRLVVRDDGVGGADERLGSGVVGMRDRVGAHNGRMWVRSPQSAGTTLEVELPIEAPEAQGSESETVPARNAPAGMEAETAPDPEFGV